MILGIGTDIIEIERIKKACFSTSFLKRVYSETEISMFRSNIIKLADNFAVKEAVSKALGTGFRGFEPRDIEVLRNISGKPEVFLYNGAMNIFNEIHGKYIHVSISNTKDIAVAYVIIEGD